MTLGGRLDIFPTGNSVQELLSEPTNSRAANAETHSQAGTTSAAGIERRQERNDQGRAVVAQLYEAVTTHEHTVKPMGMRSRGVIAAVLFLGTVPCVCSDPAGAEMLSPTRTYQVTQPLTDDEGRVATNISGLACMPADGALSKCLVIDDQGRFAQIARFENGVVAAGAKLPLIGVKPSKDTVGRPPAEPSCSGGPGKYKDLDGEAVAYSSPSFFIVGSHGCSRHGNKFRSSSFILARIPEASVVGASSDPTLAFDASTVQTSYRLSEALAAVPRVRSYFTKDLISGNGLNIEGLVVSGGKLFAGLRAPTLDAKAFIITIDVDKLFEPGAPISETDVRVILVPLGPGRGIRDLAWLRDGQLLVLSGPAQDVQLPFEIHVLNIVDGATALLGSLSELTEAPDAKAEAISVLSQQENVVNVLVMFDGLKNGGPREYRLLLK